MATKDRYKTDDEVTAFDAIALGDKSLNHAVKIQDTLFTFECRLYPYSPETNSFVRRVLSKIIVTGHLPHPRRPREVSREEAKSSGDAIFLGKSFSINFRQKISRRPKAYCLAPKSPRIVILPLVETLGRLPFSLQ